MEKRILIISPGPKYNLEHAFRERCLNLSQSFSGDILTSGPSKEKVIYGNFCVTRTRDPFGNSFFSTISFFWLSIFKVFINRFTDPYDLICTYDPLKTGLIGLIVARLSGTKLVVEVNGDYTNKWNYSEIKSPIKRYFKRKAVLFVEKIVLRNSDGVKLLYHGQVDYFRPLRRPIIEVFPNYVNASRFHNIEHKKEILFVGAPMYVKGLDVLVSAFDLISPHYPDWTLKILGYYPNKSELQALLGARTNVRFHPPVDPDLMPDHIGSCGLFVLPSRTEAMGRVLVESMAAGKPRIGSSVGGIPTVIEDGIDGLLFESENVEDLARKLRMVLDDADLRDRLGMQAVLRYQSDFRPAVYFERLVKFYERVQRRWV
ncbi:glycosyltransferase family 4 protein [Marinobacter maroccanus]|uniref:glycosyltransferase family 4 protein n=1 Tax=Marinobacter maroccanus TaxID=2055143 RepID=UPI001304A68F|nr:glycosyltransferase family 4 protein [Marinobacter maroccanus]